MEQVIAQLVKGKTLLVIAHKLSAVRDADQILVMKEGNLEAAGTHAELLLKSEEYQRLWRAHEGSRSWKLRAQGGEQR